MKKIEMRTLLFAIAIGLVAATSANAGLATLHSTPNDLPDLPQLAVYYSTPNNLSEPSYAEYFVTGINSTPSPNETTTGTALTFSNIWGWTNKSDNLLFDNLKSGAKSYIDNQGGGDYSTNKSPLAGNWPNLICGKPQNFNPVFDFGSLGLLNMRNNLAETIPGPDKANGFKIDPDYNDFSYDMTPAMTTKTKTPAAHHSP
jgi:hypothetical protein